MAVRAAPVERLAVYSHPTPGPQGTVRTCIISQDRYGNPSAFNTTVTAELDWCDQTQAVALQQSEILDLEAPSDIGRVQLSVPMNALGPEENIKNGRIQGDRIVVLGNPVWADLPGALKPVFGEIHWHTELSADGQRSITEAIRCARDYLNMDFVAPGDHQPMGDAWQQTVAGLEEFNSPDDFATLFGREHGGYHGHQNYYFIDPYHPVRPDGRAKITDAVSDVVETLRQHQDFVAVPHHTNAVAETRSLEDDRPFWHLYPWGKPEVYLRLVEIMQCRGNQERNVYDDVGRGWHQNNNASVQDALAHGHTLDFTGGTDNHCGWPGRAGACSVILTGVWAERIERQSIFEALYDRHTWAVWDTHALVWFAVNDILGGGELETKAREPLKARIKLSVEAPLQSVEIVSEGESVWIDSFTEMDIDVEVPLGQAQTSAYFYLRALQRDGGIIYASPVFVAVS